MVRVLFGERLADYLLVGVFSARVPVHKGIAIVFSLFRIYWSRNELNVLNGIKTAWKSNLSVSRH